MEAFVDAGLDLGAAIGLWMSEWWLFFLFFFFILSLPFGLKDGVQCTWRACVDGVRISGGTCEKTGDVGICGMLVQGVRMKS